MKIFCPSLLLLLFPACVAPWTKAVDPAMRAELKQQMLTRDRDRSRVKISKLEKQLRSLDDLDAVAERELQRLKKLTKVKLSKRQRIKRKGTTKIRPAKSVLPARKRSDLAIPKDRSIP